MNISLTSDMEAWVREQVASGTYRSASELLRDAVQELRARLEVPNLQGISLADLEPTHVETIDDLRREVQHALDRGETVEWSDDLREKILREGAIRRKQRKALARETTANKSHSLQS